jgi:hypothetical protein
MVPPRRRDADDDPECSEKCSEHPAPVECCNTSMFFDVMLCMPLRRQALRCYAESAAHSHLTLSNYADWSPRRRAPSATRPPPVCYTCAYHHHLTTPRTAHDTAPLPNFRFIYVGAEPGAEWEVVLKSENFPIYGAKARLVEAGINTDEKSLLQWIINPAEVMIADSIASYGKGTKSAIKASANSLDTAKRGTHAAWVALQEAQATFTRKSCREAQAELQHSLQQHMAASKAFK